ncbi:MAG: CHAP domain-containing protein [Acidimicrobiales bacterium]|jgi:surface antigen
MIRRLHAAKVVTAALIATTVLPAAVALGTIGAPTALARTSDARGASASASELCSGYAACTAGGDSSHDYQDHSWNSYWSMDAGDECTNYVAYVESAVYKVATPTYLLGNASSWPANARAHGVVVNHVPSVGAVAEWDGYSAGIGPSGHVAVVERVGPNDSWIDVSQQHIASDVDGFDWERIPIGNQGWEPWPSNFVHFSVPSEHVAVHVNSGGRMQAFLVGVSSHLYTEWQSKTGTWSGWRSLGGSWPAGDPIAVGFDPDRRLEVFLVGPDSRMYTAWQEASGRWTGWKSLGGSWPIGGSIGLGTDPQGHMQLFAVGSDGRLHTLWQTPRGPWSGWRTLGRSWPSSDSVTVGADGSGRLHVFLVGGNSRLYTLWQMPNGAWSEWHSLGGDWPVGSLMELTSQHTGRLQLFGVGSNSELYTRWQTTTGAWSSWQSLGRSWRTVASMAVASDATGYADVFVVAGNSQLLTRAETAGDSWSGWRSIGRRRPWPPTDAVAVAVGDDGSGRLHVFLAAGNSRLYTAWQSKANGSWSGWLTIG